MVSFETLNEVIFFNSVADDKGIIFIKEHESDEFMSYKDIYSRSLSLLGYFNQVGIKKGDKIILQLTDTTDFICTLWACLLGGIIPVTVPLSYSEEHRVMIFKLFQLLDNCYLAISRYLFEFMGQLAETRELKNYYEQIKPKSIIIDSLELADSVGTLEQVKEEDIALMQFSSGSTGEPKGVMLTHKNLVSNIKAIIKASKQVPSDSTLSWMPLTHGIGLIGFHLTPLLAQINQTIMDTSIFLKNPIDWLESISRYKPTFTASPNFGFKYILDNLYKKNNLDLDLSSIRLIYNGAEPVSVELCDKFITTMKDYNLKENVMFPVYGMAEASLAISFPKVGEKLKQIVINRNKLCIGDKIDQSKVDKDSVALVDVGYAVEGCSIRICNDFDEELGEAYVGNIQISGENIFGCYFNNVEKTKESFTKDGWFKTGDIGFLLDSRLIVTGRKKDIIFVNGGNYYPQDIERIAEKLSGIGQESIVATSLFSSDLQKDEILLFIVSELDIEKFADLADRLVKNMLKEIGIEIKEVIPIKEIPKTNSRKPQRYKLVDRYVKNEFSSIIEQINALKNNASLSIENKMDPSQSIYTETEKKVMQVCMEVLESDSIGIDNNFIEFGGNSIKLAKIQDKLNKIFPSTVTIANIFSYPTIAKLSAFIDKENGSSSYEYREQIYQYEQNNQALIDGVRNILIDGSRLSSLRMLSQYIDVEICNVLMGILAYSMISITEETRVDMKVLKNENRTIENLKLELKNFNSMMDIFTEIKEQLIDNIEKISLDTIVINNTSFFYDELLICDSNIANIEKDILKLFKGAIALDINQNYINLEFYGDENIDEYLLSESLAEPFVDILDNILDSFRASVEEKNFV